MLHIGSAAASVHAASLTSAITKDAIANMVWRPFDRTAPHNEMQMV